MTVTMAAVSIIPTPTAMPMTAVTKMQAAVVMPETPSAVLMISPAPMKPMPVRIWAAMRPGSPL